MRILAEETKNNVNKTHAQHKMRNVLIAIDRFEIDRIDLADGAHTSRTHDGDVSAHSFNLHQLRRAQCVRVRRGASIEKGGCMGVCVFVRECDEDSECRSP